MIQMIGEEEICALKNQAWKKYKKKLKISFNHPLIHHLRVG